MGFSEGGFDNWDWGQFGKAAAMGAASGVATAGIGSAFGSVGSAGITGELGRAMAHGVSNTMISAAFGNEVNMVTFGMAAASSLKGSGLHNLGGAAQIGGSALTGGIGAELSGGDFWRGAAVGGTIAGLNHAAHQVTKEKDPRAYRKKCKCYNALAERAAKMGDAAGYGSGVAGVGQLGMLRYRQSLPLSSKIGTFGRFSAAYGAVGAGRVWLGRFGTAGSVFSVISNYQSMSSGQITAARFSYRVSGIGASTAMGSYIGAQFGGPWGAVAGTLIGLGWSVGESLYDMWNNTVMPAMRNVMPTGGWYPPR